MNTVDLVVPYVDSSDSQWQELFTKYNPDKNAELEEVNARNRFRGQGQFFRFWFRCVEKNMPWIRKIHLIVQSESQIPSWIDREKVHIVFHSDIIPAEFLPTFNSTCIEMFLWKIEDLSEKFIYANDDFYVVRKTSENDFFKEDTVYRKFIKILNKPNLCMYLTHCLNCYCMINDLKKEEVIHYNSFKHCMRPYLKSKMIECYNKYEKEILESITPFRNRKNFNIYLFDNYLIRYKHTFDHSNLTTGCIDVKMSKLNKLNTLNSSCLVAIQDALFKDVNVYDDPTLINWFDTKYKNKCIYEITTHDFKVDISKASEDSKLPAQYEWYQKAHFYGWCSNKEYEEFMKKYK